MIYAEMSFNKNKNKIDGVIHLKTQVVPQFG
jgi:hypothetical protein